MKKDRLLTTILLTILWQVHYGQFFDMEQYALSPNAATLGQYGEIPVSPFTGTPHIEIPIYEFAVDGHKFPISINYHTSGIRIEQNPSWVGAGWNLVAGGSIMRRQNGAADEDHVRRPENEVKSRGYFYNLSHLNKSSWGTLAYINSYMSNQNPQSLFEGDDVDADEFQFSFMGYSGSFFMDHEGAWKFRCDRILRVDSMKLDTVPFRLSSNRASTHTKVIKGFLLTADDGTRYRFGYSEDAVDYAIPYSNQYMSNWTTTAWHLTEISYPNGSRVVLNYVRGKLAAQTWYDLSQRSVQYSDYDYPVPTHSPDYQTPVGSLISPSYLADITFPNGHITFHTSEHGQLEHGLSSTQTDLEKYYYLIKGIYGNDTVVYYNGGVLDSIIVENNDNVRIHKSVFRYRSNSAAKLGLNELAIGVTDTDSSLYTFGYYRRNMLPNQYDIRKTDHWGYYIPTQWNSPFIWTYRNSVDSVAGYGALNKITYPTGGYTRLEYEPHKCSKVLNSTKTAVVSCSLPVGGCRIRRIINSATGLSRDEQTMKEYFYVKDYVTNMGNSEISSGVLAALPEYDVSNYVLQCPTKNSLSCSINMTCMMHPVHSGGTNSHGSHIGYSEVVERFPNGSMKVYKYSNYDNGYMDNTATAVYDNTRRDLVRFSSLEHTRGLLLQCEEYDSLFAPLKINTYTYSMDTTNFIRGFYINVLDRSRYNVVQGKYYPILEACTYKHYLSLPKLMKETERVYYSGLFNERYRRYEYNELGQVSRQVENGHLNDSIVTNMQYIWQMPTFNDCDFVWSPVYEVERLAGGENWDKKTYVYSRKGTNLYVASDIMETHYLPIRRDTTHCEYDNRGRLLFRAYNGHEPTVYLWSYEGQHIVGILQGATLEQVRAVLNCTNDYLGNLPVSNDAIMNTLRSQLPNALVTSYKYAPLVGMIQETSPAGISKYYEYDSSGRLTGIRNDNGEYIETYNYHLFNRE